MNKAKQTRERAKTLTLLASVLTDKSFSTQKAMAYASVLKHLSDEEFKTACGQVGIRFRNVPPPIEFMRIVRPEIDIDAEANESAARITGAIAMFGYTNPKEAEAYIGALGWSVVEKFGGWQHICENLLANQTGTFRAQIRDVTKATIQRQKIGRAELPPGLDNLIDFNEKRRIENATSNG